MKNIENYEFGKSVIENLTAMSEQRDFDEVKSECNSAFGVELGDTDPLREALNHAKTHKGNCLVIQDDWFMKVPSKKTDLWGWVQCFKIWDSIEEQKRIAQA